MGPWGAGGARETLPREAGGTPRSAPRPTPTGVDKTPVYLHLSAAPQGGTERHSDPSLGRPNEPSGNPNGAPTAARGTYVPSPWSHCPLGPIGPLTTDANFPKQRREGSDYFIYKDPARRYT